jgi:hypothetical protein
VQFHFVRPVQSGQHGQIDEAAGFAW